MLSLADSYQQLKRHNAEELKGRLSVRFLGEEGLDAGGLAREWFLVLSREIFNPNYALFRPSANNTNVFQPNKFSFWNREHLQYARVQPLPLRFVSGTHRSVCQVVFVRGALCWQGDLRRAAAGRLFHAVRARGG